MSFPHILALFIRPLDHLVDLLWPPRHRVDPVDRDIAAAHTRNRQ